MSFFSKLVIVVSGGAEKANFFVDKTPPKGAEKKEDKEKTTVRKANAGDQDKLKKLENKKRDENGMENLCDKVEAQIPPAPPRQKGNSTKVEKQRAAIGIYLYSHPHIQVDGHSGGLSQDASVCYQYRLNQAEESDRKADDYNHSKKGQAEMKRQTEIDNARLRAYYQRNQTTLKKHPQPKP